MEKRNRRREAEYISKLGAIALLVVILLKSNCYGWDKDESYVLFLGYQLLNGEKLWIDLWDLHQFSAVFTAIAMLPYLKIIGLTGIALYMRTISTVVSLSVAIIAYRVGKRHHTEWAAYIGAIFVLVSLPRATQNVEYGLLLQSFAMVSVLLLYDVYQSDDRECHVQFVLSGLFYGLSVFVYPTFICSLPAMVIALLLLERRKGHSKRQIMRGLMLWIAPSFFMLVLLGTYCFQYLNLGDFYLLLKEIINSGDHTETFSFLHNWKTNISLLIEFTLVIVAACGMDCLIHRKWQIRWKQIAAWSILAYSISLIGLNICGIRPSGPFGLAERYILILILLLALMQLEKSYVLLLTVVLPGIFIYIATLLGSNLGLKENALFLVPALLGCIWNACDRSACSTERFMRTAIIVWVICAIFSRLYFVRIDGTGPANATEMTYEISEGVLQGIRISEERAAELEQKCIELQDNTDIDTTYILITDEPIYNFYVNGKIQEPRYTSTPIYGTQWINYYQRWEHALPEYIWIDQGGFDSVEDFENQPFGNWIKEQYQEIDSLDGFWILQKELESERKTS